MAKKKVEVGVKANTKENVNTTKENLSEPEVFGEKKIFQTISSEISLKEGWTKSTKAMEIAGVGCVIQVSARQGDEIAVALTFVPGVRIESFKDGDVVVKRKIVQI